MDRRPRTARRRHRRPRSRPLTTFHTPPLSSRGAPPPLVILSERSESKDTCFASPRPTPCHPERAKRSKDPALSSIRSAPPTHLLLPPSPAFLSSATTPCHPERAQRVEGHLFCSSPPPPLVILSERSESKDICFAPFTATTPCHPERAAPAPCHPERAQRVEGHLFCFIHRHHPLSSRGAKATRDPALSSIRSAPPTHPTPAPLSS